MPDWLGWLIFGALAVGIYGGAFVAFTALRMLDTPPDDMGPVRGEGDGVDEF